MPADRKKLEEIYAVLVTCDVALKPREQAAAARRMLESLLWPNLPAERVPARTVLVTPGGDDPLMTPPELDSWLQRFDDLTSEIQADKDPQSLMVAACMLFLRAQFPSLAEGDERNLRALFAFTSERARHYLAERDAQNTAPS